jgi:tetratricopeptide (TPR) repeat protein
MRVAWPLVLMLMLMGGPVMAVDVLSLWDFSQPELSEQRFREALKQVKGDDALTLQTQIARTYGLRKRFDEAQRVLDEIKPLLAQHGPEPNARWHLEWGRTLASAAHGKASQTPQVQQQAREAFTQAFEIAHKAGLGYIAVDALHMMSFTTADAAQQLGYDLKAVEYMQSSTDPEARKWEGSLRNNVGWSLNKAGRFEEADKQLRLALAAREREGKPARVRVAWWMVAWNLRHMLRIDDALEIQLRLESENAAVGTPDAFVFEELALLYEAKGDSAKAAEYQARRQALQKP